jgi:hypothetical protein
MKVSANAACVGKRLQVQWRRTNEVAMHMRRWTILAVATSLAVGQTAAQRYDPRYPVCFEAKQQGSIIIDCSFTSLPQWSPAG